ncbi:hypothetical protein D9757_004642 [Collybiopsis confluens]|uniref:Glycogenin n=1 Tax=Collybiopsis confluens TaxID=2823264 RepID=A0A8H5HS98_9AGAR|nr:hypothetical protein D9757_004642 [Collybiopsis confluens]
MPFAFVTLLTSDHYLPGALTLVAALRDIHPSPAFSPEVDFQTVCLVTPETVDVSIIKLLRKTFDAVIGVEVIAQRDEQGLELLARPTQKFERLKTSITRLRTHQILIILFSRPDLNQVLTKLHVFRLVQYQKIIFLDADVLPVRPLSHLFTLPHEFSAVPDVGWPDIFNSGVLVLSPGEDKFTELHQLLKTRGSWDGGDQGILNEWRGNDWNRLSFTYNTTPTAAYTYAPAYERFGKEISALHFIGPNKPWKSIQYRAPFLSQQASSSSSSQRAYDYDSLVDKWFQVYDVHYRVQNIIQEPKFEVQKYKSAWDEPSQSGISPSGVLDLDALRNLAIRGINSAGAPENKYGEGEYKSLPLEGRVDLMRPKPVSKASEEKRLSVDTQPFSTPSARDSLRTPGPEELPLSPHPQPISLPPTPSLVSREHPLYYERQPSLDPEDHQAQYLQYQSLHPHLDEKSSALFSHHPPPTSREQPALHQQHLPEPLTQPHYSPPRPPSPPKLLWNPAIDPPPNTAPSVSAFPSDTYFENIWDQPQSKHHDRTHQHKQHAMSPTPDSGAFFEPPLPGQIPERIQEHYRSVTGDVDRTAHTGPVPDLTKVKPIFPWEDKPRSKPNRMFPVSDALPPTLITKAAEEKPEVVEPLHLEPKAEPVTEMISPSKPRPPRGLPTSLSYANAWDTVPSIQRYASRLVRPPPPLPAPVPFDSEDYWRGRKGWDDKAEESSRDGDDEDNTDTDDGEPVVSRLADSDNETSVSGSISHTRSRRGSSASSSHGMKSKKKEYRVRGVQTISPEMKSQAVQVAILVDPSKVSQRSIIQDQATWPAKTSLTLDTGNPKKPQWITSGRGGSPGLKDSLSTGAGAGGGDTFGSLSLPPDVLSPREFGFSHTPPSAPSSSSTITPSSAHAPLAVPSTADSPLIVNSQPLVPLRQISNESVTPPSSDGPLSPPEGHPIGSAALLKKAGRVFDPARGVEVFKRGSEEVLARFLKMSSWEDEVSPQR